MAFCVSCFVLFDFGGLEGGVLGFSIWLLLLGVFVCLFITQVFQSLFGTQIVL